MNFQRLSKPRLVEPAALSGHLRAPASKSGTVRAIFAATLARGTNKITQASRCEDAEAALRLAAACGVSYSWYNNVLVLESTASATGGVVDCGESAFCARAGAFVAATFNSSFTFIGGPSLSVRSLQSTIDYLSAFGAHVSASPHLPLTVEGPLSARSINLNAALTSQSLSGLLMALPKSAGDSQLRMTDLVSSQYILLTLEVVRKFGINIDVSPDLELFRIPGGQRYLPTNLEVEGDWSGAAFYLVAGALSGPVSIEGLNGSSLQPDRMIIEILQSAGASVKLENSQYVISKPISSSSQKLHAFTANLASAPDLFPAAVVLALFCHGTSRLDGADRLRDKESDRAKVMLDEFRELGGELMLTGNTMFVTGSPLGGGAVSSHGDHRIAMALSIAACHSEAPITIDDTECVNKSYPAFFEDLARLKGL